jgi:hypothetical protein
MHQTKLIVVVLLNFNAGRQWREKSIRDSSLVTNSVCPIRKPIRRSSLVASRMSNEIVRIYGFYFTTLLRIKFNIHIIEVTMQQMCLLRSPERSCIYYMHAHFPIDQLSASNNQTQYTHFLCQNSTRGKILFRKFRSKIFHVYTRPSTQSNQKVYKCYLLTCVWYRSRKEYTTKL